MISPNYRPFGGLAAALVCVGVSAVLAMQRPTSDQAAVLISQMVYRRLAEGETTKTISKPLMGPDSLDLGGGLSLQVQSVDLVKREVWVLP